MRILQQQKMGSNSIQRKTKERLAVDNVDKVRDIVVKAEQIVAHQIEWNS